MTGNPNYYFFADCDEFPFLGSECSALKVSFGSEFVFGHFDSKGIFIPNPNHGIEIDGWRFTNFKLVSTVVEHNICKEREFQIDYYNNQGAGKIAFIGTHVEEKSLVELLRIFIPFLQRNIKSIGSPKFTYSLFSPLMFRQSYKDYFEEVISLDVKARESSEYRARRDNLFYTDIIINIPAADEYFKTLLYKFCDSTYDLIKFDRIAGIVIYREQEYTAFTESFDDRISDIDWMKGKFEFYSYLKEHFDLDEYLREAFFGSTYNTLD